MTPQEQIASLRGLCADNYFHADADDILAVCDLAERALLTDDEAEAVRWDMEGHGGACMTSTVRGILRRLLPDVPAEHHRVQPRSFVGAGNRVYCSCGWEQIAGSTDAAVRAWVAHAGIGHD